MTDALFDLDDFTPRRPTIDKPIEVGDTVHCSYPDTWPSGPYETEIGVVTDLCVEAGEAIVDFCCGGVNRPLSWLEVVEP